MPASAFYQRLAECGLRYGPAFQCVEQLWRRDREALGRLRLPPELQRQPQAYQVHPILLAGMMQLVAAAVPAGLAQAPASDTYIPIGLAGLCFHRPLRPPCWGHVVIRQMSANQMEADLRLLDEAGQVTLEIAGCRLHALGAIVSGTGSGPPDTSPLPGCTALAADVAPAAVATLDRATLLAADEQQRHALLLPYLRKQLADTVGLDESKLDVTIPIQHFGLDSLMILKLVVRLELALGLKIAVSVLMDGPSVEILTTKLIESMSRDADITAPLSKAQHHVTEISREGEETCRPTSPESVLVCPTSH
jgi:acyl transferase domain-containing protein